MERMPPGSKVELQSPDRWVIVELPEPESITPEARLAAELHSDFNGLLGKEDASVVAQWILERFRRKNMTPAVWDRGNDKWVLQGNGLYSIVYNNGEVSDKFSNYTLEHLEEEWGPLIDEEGNQVRS
jgi:hypothetical protein